MAAMLKEKSLKVLPRKQTHDAHDLLPAAQPTSEADAAVPLSHIIGMGAAVVLPFLGCILAIVLMWQFGWMGWLYLGMLFGGWLMTGWGITIGFHRLLSHRSFETHRWVRAFWMAMGALSVQGSPLVWCAVHRKHHALSDGAGDPHSPLAHGTGWWSAIRGFVHAHTGWLFTKHWTTADLKRYVPDLVSDPMLVWVDRAYYWWVVLSLAIPAAAGGLLTLSWKGALLGFIWGGLVRVFVVHHITFSINSICHIFGSREYESADHSKNNVLCGFLAQGEGWHNNHHAFPTSARHGLKWWQFDSSWLLIRAMQQIGLAWNVRTPSPSALAAKRIRRG